VTARVDLEIGDEIVVCGHPFILTEFRVDLNEPARVTFVQPIELLARPT